MFNVGYQDTLPVLETLVSNDNGYIDLTNATGAYFVFQPKSRYINAQTGQCSIVGPTSGHLRYNWTTTDLISGYGFYYGQFRVHFSGNNRITFPNDRLELFSINHSL